MDSLKRFKEQYPLLSDLVFSIAGVVAFVAFFIVIGDPYPSRFVVFSLIFIGLRFFYKLIKRMDADEKPSDNHEVELPAQFPGEFPFAPPTAPATSTYIVGIDMPAGRYMVTNAAPGDVLIISTDGIIFDAAIDLNTDGTLGIMLHLREGQKLEIRHESKSVFSLIDAPIPNRPPTITKVVKKKPHYKDAGFMVFFLIVISLIGIVAIAGMSSCLVDSARQAIIADMSAPTAAQAPPAPALSRDNSSAELTTLFAGYFGVGRDIPIGRYVITADGPGDLSVGSRNSTRVNAILDPDGDMGVPSLTIYLYRGETIEIRDINNVVFTPAETQLSTILTAGDWIVGLDIPAGTYNASATNNGDYGDFLIFADSSASPSVNQILGGDGGVDRIRVNLQEGQLIQIHDILSVTFEQQ